MYPAPSITAVVQITHLAYIWYLLGFSLIPITFLQLFVFLFFAFYGCATTQVVTDWPVIWCDPMQNLL
jgi:hypothetical protein